MLGEDSFFQREAVYPMICTNCYIISCLARGQELGFLLVCVWPSSVCSCGFSFPLGRRGYRLHNDLTHSTHGWQIRVKIFFREHIRIAQLLEIKRPQKTDLERNVGFAKGYERRRWRVFQDRGIDSTAILISLVAWP